MRVEHVCVGVGVRSQFAAPCLRQVKGLKDMPMPL